MLHPTKAWRSWGRTLRAEHHVARPAFADQVRPAMREARGAGLSLLPVGLGRSYGDTNLNPGQALIDMRGLDRFIAFDRETGVLRAEAGASLGEILKLVVPYGWFLPTTPGTRFVTLGGAVANDVHGKNHHSAGTFGRHVRRLALLRTDHPDLLEIGPDAEPELFAATVGGLGLTGLILWAEIQLVRIGSTSLVQRVEPFGGLADFFRIAREAEGRWEHTVAWIDCTAGGSRLGRGLFNMANWAEDGERRAHDHRTGPSLPFEAPGLALNPLTLKAFNALYYARGRMSAGTSRVHYTQAFYPLDAIGRWNLLYGPRGFFQHQCVVPHAEAPDAIAALLTRIARSGEGSFLAVLKNLGDRPSPGLLSFPRPGVTLALDFRNKGPETLALLADLDEIVRSAGGRLYAAKDGRAPAAMWRAGYPELARFAAFVDPAFNSAFWRRVST
jgi:FAD/FMN-containing dehydrogenase